MICGKEKSITRLEVVQDIHGKELIALESKIEKVHNHEIRLTILEDKPKTDLNRASSLSGIWTGIIAIIISLAALVAALIIK